MNHEDLIALIAASIYSTRFRSEDPGEAEREKYVREAIRLFATTRRLLAKT